MAPLRRLLLVAVLAVAPLASSSGRPLVIAHRGASGYLPEHTLESAAYAHALGADYIEQDVVLSKDDILVVIHDIHLDTTTDVAARFPGRARADGRFYAIDFTWSELASLTVRERFDAATGQQVFPGRFPANGARFRLCTLDEQIRLIQGLNQSTGRTAGLYVEFKEPAWHAREGKDLGATLLTALSRHGYAKRSDPVFVQCFEPGALRRLRDELRTELALVQLISSGASQAALTTPEGLRGIAAYAQGVGPAIGLVAGVGPNGLPMPTTLVRDAHAAGLVVHPYTFRADALPADTTSLAALLDFFLREAGIDGFFTDHPDAGLRAVRSLP